MVTQAKQVRNVEAESFWYNGRGNLVDADNNPLSAGWYWRPEMPANYADSLARGPFGSEREAIFSAVQM